MEFHMNGVRPPWTLGGYCMMIFYLVSSKRMMSFVPAPLEIADVMPGLTLSGFYAASYKTGVSGVLSEFSAFPALVRYQKKKGFYVPCSKVESREDAYRQKAAWGLHQEKAVFEWKEEKSRYILTVQCEGKKIIEIHLSARRISLPIRASFSFFHVRGNGVVSYHADYTARVHLSTSAVEIPENSPLTIYGFNRKLITTFWESSKIVLHPPESEKIVIPKGVSEGVFQVGQEPLDSCGVKKSADEYSSCHSL